MISQPANAVYRFAVGWWLRGLLRAADRGQQFWQNPTARKGLLSLSDQALVSGTSFVTTIMVGRICGKEALGGYVLAMSALLFCKGVQDQLIAAPYVIFSPRKSTDHAQRYAGSVLVHQLLLALLASVVIAAIGWFQGDAHGTLPTPFIIAAAVAPLYLLREYVRSFSFAHLRLPTAILFDGTISLLQFGLLSFCVCQGMLLEQTALLASGFACGLTTVGWFLCKRQRFEFTTTDTLTDWKQNWAFGRWALASQLLVTALAYVLPWILTWTHGTHETGALGASNAITGIANLFVIGLSNLFCPLAAQAFSTGGKTALERSLRMAAGTFVAVLGPLAAVQWLAGDLLPLLLFGQSFAGSGWLVTVLMTGLLINSLGIVAGNGLWALERPQANFAADVTGLLVGLLTTLWLVAAWGSLGAALATLAGHTAGAVVRFITLRRLLSEISDSAK